MNRGAGLFPLRERVLPLPTWDSVWAWKIDPKASSAVGNARGGARGGTTTSARPVGRGADPFQSRGSALPGNRPARCAGPHPGAPQARNSSIFPERAWSPGPGGCVPSVGGHSRRWAPWARLPGDPGPRRPAVVTAWDCPCFSSRAASVGVWPPCLSPLRAEEGPFRGRAVLSTQAHAKSRTGACV